MTTRTVSLLLAFLSMIVDVVASIILLLYACILGPLGVLRGPLRLESGLQYLFVLAPLGRLRETVGAAVDWRFGRFDATIGQIESVVSAIEGAVRQRPNSRMRRRVAEDFYTLLARCYLHTGRIDDAMQVVIRAKKNIGTDRLRGLAELDSKTAHLVRAGLAAGRLLEGGGLATLFVKSSHMPGATNAPERERDGRGKLRSTDGKRGRRHPPDPAEPLGTTDVPLLSNSDDDGAKIIPFPRPDPYLN